jgi:hypothetical protein
VSGFELETSSMRRARATVWCLAMSMGSLGKGFIGLCHVNLYFCPICLNICCSNQRCAFNALVSCFFPPVGAVVLTDVLCDFDVINRPRPIPFTSV